MPRRTSARAVCGRTSDVAAQTADDMLAGGDMLGALVCIQHAVVLRPDSTPLLVGMADVLGASDRVEEAAAGYDRALRLQPFSAEIYHRLGHMHGRREETATALAAFDAASQLAPDFAENLHALAVCHSLLYDWAASERALQRSIRIRPTLTSVHFDLALAQQQLKKPLDALKHYNAYLAAGNDIGDLQHVQTLANRASTLADLDRSKEAVRSYEAALKLAPAFPEVYANLAILHNSASRPDLALAALAAGRALAPTYSQMHLNHGLTLKQERRYDEAATAFGEAVRLDPLEAHDALGHVTFARKRSSNWRGWEVLMHDAQKVWRAGQGGRSWDPLYGLALPLRLPMVRQMAMDRGAQIATEAQNRMLQMQQQSAWPLAKRTAGLQTLRVGYLSADYGLTAVGGTMRGFFSRHARQPDKHFDVFAFSVKRGDESDLYEEVVRAVDLSLARFQVHDGGSFAFTHFPGDRSAREQISRLGSDRGAERVAPRRFVDLSVAHSLHAAGAALTAAQLHVLVDLNGYTDGERAEIHMLKPAPVTMHAIGYPATMGSEYVRYILADKQAALPAPQAHLALTERLVLLPHCYLVNGHRDISEYAPPPAEDSPKSPGAGMKLVLINFNQLYKLEPRTLLLFCNILRQRGGRALLWMRRQPQASAPVIEREAMANGIWRGSLVFADYEFDEHENMRRISQAHLSLDTPEYNGHTTGNDMLWSNVPLLSVPGEHLTARMGRSLLAACGSSPGRVDSLRQLQGLAHALAASSLGHAFHRVEYRSIASVTAQPPRPALQRSRRRVRADAFPAVAELQRPQRPKAFPAAAELQVELQVQQASIQP